MCCHYALFYSNVLFSFWCSLRKKVED
uniref:Uncharacterized protein n=1 Tax=Arundo donax TaxID=35708 RepID=A0A0A9HQJ9_ARUDO